MKKHSCGAILYTIQNNKVYVILGMEKGEWFPFKGVRELGETNKQAAIREICEEMCHAVTENEISDIDLGCNYSTKRKYYHIGLVYIPFANLDQFYINRYKLLGKKYTEYTSSIRACLEKTDIMLFDIDNIFNHTFHNITQTPIQYYYSELKQIQSNILNQEFGSRSTNSFIFTNQTHIV